MFESGSGLGLALSVRAIGFRMKGRVGCRAGLRMKGRVGCRAGLRMLFYLQHPI